MPRTYTSATDPSQSCTIADPGNITQDECLALAKLGHEAWNSWRGGHLELRNWFKMK